MERQTPLGTAEKLFAAGKLAYEKEDWQEAIRNFEEVRVQSPASSMAQEATYLEAMSRYNSDMFSSAALDFHAVRRNYPNSPLAARAQYMAGESYYQISPRPELDQSYTILAVSEYQLFIRDYPKAPSSLIDSAQKRIADLRDKLSTKYFLSAQLYDKLAPDSPHAQHMTSHIFLALGMWPEVEQANINARRAIEKRRGPDHAFACGHGGIWLVYARLEQGLSADNQIGECRGTAEVGLKDPSKLTPVGFSEGAVGSHADMVVRRWVETGAPIEPIALPSGMMNFAHFTYAYGQVLAARHDPDASRAALQEMTAALNVLRSDFRKEFPDDDQTMPWLELAYDQAKAVAVLAEGGTKPDLARLRALAERETALPAVFGPPPLQKPGWELLGDELLAAGDKAGAAAAYRQSLRLQPGRRLSLAGLKKATS